MDPLFDALLRGASALVWAIATVRVVRDRNEIPDALRRILSTLSLAVVLTVIAVGPFLLPEFGAWFVKTLYTATAAAVLIVGLAFASVRVRA
jgi:hypothetical protein